MAPSLLSADFSRLGEEADDAKKAGADLLHVDCMDGHFAPNLTIGPCVVEALRRVSDLPLDVHLMIADPGKYLDLFLDAGSDLVSFHVEAVGDARPLLDRIAERGAVPALALSPDTPADRVRPYLDRIGMVLVMSVYPGFGGQSFMDSVLPKIERIREWVGPEFLVEVDGGIGPGTVGRARAAGANVLVAGSAVFGQPDRAAAIRALLAGAERAGGGMKGG